MTIWQRLCCSLAQLLAYVVLVAAHAAWRSALAFSWVRTGLRKRVLALAAPQEDQPCELSFRPGGKARAGRCTAATASRNCCKQCKSNATGALAPVTANNDNTHKYDCSVAGFTLGQFSLRISSSSGNSSSGPVRLQEVSVAQLSVEWPSLRQNLKLHVHGLSVKLQQLQAPPVRSPQMAVVAVCLHRLLWVVQV
jgi:hypothetical protein